jgi:hypothetical protein
MKQSGDYVLDVAMLMKETILCKGKQNLKKLATLSRLHMRNQKVSRVDKTWSTLKEEANE